MKVLSLFDGMSCGQIALKQLGIIPEVYYASEIDKHAIKQTQLNFPDTIQLGSVTDIDVSKLERIDLIIGGSPCTDLSMVGKRLGMSTTNKEEILTLEHYLKLKEEGFQFEGQSYLFWEYMRILTDIRKYNPNVLFLLENVEMGKKWEEIFNKAIGMYGVHIDSALLSAQRRRRIYWTNIRTKKIGLLDEIFPDIPQPEDKKIFLRDILEKDVDEKYYIKNKKILKHITDEKILRKGYTQINGEKAMTYTARQYVSWTGSYVCLDRQDFVSCLTPKRTDYGKAIRKDYEAGRIREMRINIQKLEPRHDGKTNCLTSVQKDNLLIIPKTIKKDFIEGFNIRRLTPTECARLQTIPDWYKWDCSETQQYRMLGNGWTVDVIVHILSFMKE